MIWKHTPGPARFAIRCIAWALALAVCEASMCGGPLIRAEELKVGVAESLITPPNGFPMAGYYHERLATGTTDPLKAKAIVFQGKEVQAAWVACDLTGIAVDLTTEVRLRAERATGIPARNIALSASHSRNRSGQAPAAPFASGL